MQEQLKQNFLTSIQQNKMAHAILLNGKSGYDTLRLALWYAGKLICSNDAKCLQRVEDMQHADLHMIFPLAPNESNKKPISTDYISQFRTFVDDLPYGNLEDWMNHVGLGKKRGKIAVQQAGDIIKKVSLRSYEGGNKVVVIWYAELMGRDTANKLLKTLEEPPRNTYFILICEKIDFVLPTILSRTQVIEVPKLSEDALADFIKSKTDFEEQRVNELVQKSQFDLRIAHDLIEHDANNFDEVLVEWVRKAFVSKRDLTALNDIVKWSNNLSQWSRNNQISFLQYASEIFRQALLDSYTDGQLTTRPIRYQDFNWKAFTKYIHGNNIKGFLDEINKASYDIERNVNAKIVFLDLSIKMTRLIHRPSK